MSVYGPYASTSSTPALTSTRAVIEEGGGSCKVYVAWGSDDGTDVHSQWEISVGVGGCYKGDANGGAAFSVDGVETSTVGSSDCYLYRDSRNRAVWQYPLSSLIGTPYISASATYANRKYDSLALTVTITELATGARYSNTGTVRVTYVPLYELTAFHYVSSSEAVVEYSTTWLRDDDRFTLYKESTVTLANKTSKQLSDQQNGAVASFDVSSGTGTIALDTSKFKRTAIGLDCWLKVGFNTMAGENHFAGTTSGTLTCEDGTTCDPVSLTVKAEGLGALVTAKAEDTQAISPDEVTVTLVDGTLPCDTVVLDYAGGETSASFPYVPLDTELTFEAYGTADPGDGGADVVSTVTRKTITVASDGCRVLDCVDTGEQVTLEYKMKDADYGPELSLSPDSDEVQLAGRSRPSRYPTGSSTLSIDFEGAYEGDDDGGFRDVAEGGLCVLRFPGGGRWPVVVSSVDTSYLLGDYTELSVSCEEVDWS